MKLMEKLTEVYLKFNRSLLFSANNVKVHREMADQRTYLEKLGEPRDAFECAYFKYKCHAYYHYSTGIKILYNIMGFFAVPLYALFLAIRSRKQDMAPFVPSGAVITRSPTMSYDDILPPQIKETYNSVQEVKPLRISERRMDKLGWSFFWKTFRRYWLHPYFCLEALVRISGNCEIMYRYHPKANVGYGREREFFSPILYEYANALGVDRVSFMHGIFVYSIDKAFITFTKYYVWEPYYVEMFYALKARKGSLEVYKPKKYEPKVKPRQPGVPYDYFLTYYFTAESKERMERIRKCLDLFQKQGNLCKLRPHPRFTDVELLKQVFEGYYIEDKTWTLDKSMECSQYIAAYNSTVLAEAYYSDKLVLIDDYVDPDKFQNMIDRDYIMLHRPHTLMTELVLRISGIDLKNC